MSSFPFILPFMSAQPLESRSIPLSRTSSRSSYSALLVGTAIGEQKHPTFPDKSKVQHKFKVHRRAVFFLSL